MPAPVNQSADSWQTDDITRSALVVGLTVNQLSLAFEIGPQIVARRLAALQPSGRKGRWATYKLKEAAPLLVEPSGDLEEVVKRLNPRDLPPMLLKEFWTALRARQAFLEEEGDLWRTQDVLGTFSEAFKALRMGLLLMTDTVERSTELSETQRTIMSRMIDQTLEDLYERLVGHFKGQGGAAAAEPAPALAAAGGADYGGL